MEKKTLVVVSPNARITEYNPRLILFCVHVLRACIIVCSIVYLNGRPAVVAAVISHQSSVGDSFISHHFRIVVTLNLCIAVHGC